MKPENAAWLTSVGKGWSNKLVKPFLEAIDPCPEAHVAQIKEKFGTLCLYVSGPRWVMDLAAALEEASKLYCEDCGRITGWKTLKDEEFTKVTTAGNRWIRTLCQWCRSQGDV